MVLDKPYVSLEDTLKLLKLQVRDSINFASDFIPEDLESPQGFFYWLKPQLTFKKDPRGKELLQNFETLMQRNGRGDCDCFTIAALASAQVLQFPMMWVCLTGNTMFAPTHIYTETWDPFRKQICTIDFTNPVYNMQRSYKFKQRLPFYL